MKISITKQGTVKTVLTVVLIASPVFLYKGCVGFKQYLHEHEVVRKDRLTENYTVEREVSCSHYSYCYGSKGDGKYGMRYGYCSGDQMARLTYADFEIERRNGEVFTRTEQLNRVNLTSCD